MQKNITGNGYERVHESVCRLLVLLECTYKQMRYNCTCYVVELMKYRVNL